jgi:hypothetical protein
MEPLNGYSVERRKRRENDGLRDRRKLFDACIEDERREHSLVK